MKYIKKFEDHSSTEFYLDFKKSDFLEVIKFDEPKLEYEIKEFIPSMNSVKIIYDKTSNYDDGNPYTGDIPGTLVVDFSVTYEMGNQSTTSFFKITSGSQSWLEFSYSDGEFDYMDITKCKLSKESDELIKKILNKYSK